MTSTPRPARKPIPVTVLTGHLGSGKTTLLQRALEHPLLQHTALIINEFGEVSIDHLMVAQLAENIVQLRGGCICCAVRTRWRACKVLCRFALLHRAVRPGGPGRPGSGSRVARRPGTGS